ncbi:MAG: hypothetical protein J6D26_01120 [Clostridia bacterium]|nr:hypothetical protein [Clostridia bacterium]
MKKTLKKLLTAILVVSILFAFVGCGKDDTKEETKKVEKNYENDVEAMLEDFIDAADDMEIKDAREFLNDSEYDKGIFEYEDEDDAIDDAMKSMLSNSNGMNIEERVEAKIEEYVKKLIDMRKNSETEIKKISEDEGSYICKIERETLDSKKFEEQIGEITKEHTTEEKSLEYAQKIFGELGLTMEATESEIIEKGYTTRELQEKVANAMMFDMMDAFIDAAEAFDEFKTEEYEIVVIEDDGNWLIDTDEGDFKEWFKDE